ncbi:Hypothetical predicted protein [Paramuricea clavata]|uniref:alpha-1,6-mannosyl-glycoprotein 6-beta-N-acetylglucosaminyltransferase n=1 Tax=Paramuricea clavata TaxID=317549 RepID=A0A6S7G471_PARCT|nr:Hypothetical predicted protein [Paramuricea clavata]
MAKVKLTAIVVLLYIGVVAITIVIFTMLVNVIDNTGNPTRSTWNIANLMLNSEDIGLDGNHMKKKPVENIVDRIQKLGNVLENITNKIESMEIRVKNGKQRVPIAGRKTNNEHVRRICHIPKPTTQYPLCDEKVSYVQINWGMPCYAMENNIRHDDLCSILIYLSEIVVFLGAFAVDPRILRHAFSGGALGEMVQWSDIIVSLYLLGHDLVVVKDLSELQRYIPVPNENGCINNRTVRQFQYDLLYTDVSGIGFIINTFGPYWSELRCKTRVVDSFGTEAEFNYKKFSARDSKYQSQWGNLELNLRQFMTMFPHSPDNSFIGFVSGAANRTSKRSKKYAKQNMALVYAKQDGYWIIANRRYLDKIHEYVDIHGTFNRTLGLGDLPYFIPKYVINHGVVNGTTIDKMLQQSKVFVGLGFPYEGPAPLEAIANGAAFLNPKFTNAFKKFPVPHNRYNSEFFASKPTRRHVTSQNPYAEQFIGEPYVYTIDITNVTQVTRAMKKIMKKPLRPYLPYEYTHEGMLERISAQVEHLNFCQDSQWPPLKNMKTVKGKFSQSCKDACWEKAIYEHELYSAVLYIKFCSILMKTERIFCDSVKYSGLLVAPSYEEKTKICHLQQQPLLYSCVSSSASHMRLCPCRDYIKDQVALCKDCW